MDFVWRMDVEETDREELDAGLVSVQPRLRRLARLSLDLLSRGGVDRVYAAFRHHLPQRREDRAAHERVRFGEVVGVGESILDPILDGGSQVYEVAVARQQE